MIVLFSLPRGVLLLLRIKMMVPVYFVLRGSVMRRMFPRRNIRWLLLMVVERM